MKNNLSVILIFTFLITTQVFSQVVQPWTKLSTPTSNLLTQIHFVDSLTGWAAGGSGTIIHTKDGGESWVIQNSNVANFIHDIFFLDKNLGWALSWTTSSPFRIIILKTSDGGDNWLLDYYPENNSAFNSIYFLDSLYGFMGGHAIVKTTDGGLSWLEAYTYDVDTLPPDISKLPVKKFHFYNKQYGFASGGFIDYAGVMWRTSDFGESWAAQGVAADPVEDFSIRDSLTIVSLAGEPEGLFGIAVIRSSDAGMSWNYNELPILGTIPAVSFRTYSEGWAASEFKFIFTVDTGYTWNEFPIPGDDGIFDLIFTDSLTGYTAGQNGAVYKYIPQPVNAEPEINSLQNFNYFLHQNFPNPFNPSTNLKFRISNFEFVTLKVYDILGNEIAVLVNEEKSPGVYEVAFNAGRISSGIYFYRLTASNFSETKKMIFLK